MALVKTVGVLLMIALGLYVFFVLVHIFVGTVFVLLEVLVAALVVVAIYRHFKKQRAH